MTLKEIKQQIESEQYSFLRTNKHLGDNIILLGLGGSYSYGTNIATSDLDIRGIALNSQRELLLGKDFEQVIDTKTDTTVYSFQKMIRLLCQCNPNVIELLGLKPEHYLILKPIGQELINNRKLFLSKAAVNSFGGYANQQLRRLENKVARDSSMRKQQENVLKSIEHATVDYKSKYFPYGTDEIHLYVDSMEDDPDTADIFADIHLTHYPLKDFTGLIGDMNNIQRMYENTGQRNRNAAEHGKLAKHMMHLIRLYYMCFDILERGEINTHREAEHDELMEIRNGKYLDEHNQVAPEFYDIVEQLEKRLTYDKENTDLPDRLNMDRINDFVFSVHKSVVQPN